MIKMTISEHIYICLYLRIKMIVFNIYDADSSVCFGVGSFVAKMKQFLLLSKF